MEEGGERENINVALQIKKGKNLPVPISINLLWPLMNGSMRHIKREINPFQMHLQVIALKDFSGQPTRKK